ncbi:MAG: M15 family metallopeptidase [Prevotella sp.]|nr:M15 family metallopeptidase [Prevotella sp.]
MNKILNRVLVATCLRGFAVLAATTLVFTSCSKDDDNSVVTPVKKEYFTLWNSCEALTALQNYVQDVTDPTSKNFIKEEDRIATFDMDGTFVGELYPSYFEYNMLEYRVLDDAAYRDIAPEDVKETAQEIRDFVRFGQKLPSHFDMKHAYAAAKAYAGMTLAQFDAYVKAYAAKGANGFKGMTYGQSFYKPMLQVFDYLKDNGFTYYVVSGSDRFICRALVDAIGIAPNRVIGMDVKLRSTSQGSEAGVNYTMGKEEDLFRTDELIIKNLKANKVFQIAQEIGKVPVLSFGNSGGDAAMHNYCLSNPTYKTAAFMLIADDDTRDHANREKALTLGEQWREAGYHVISMRDDFKTIYGDGVEKTDFTFPVDTRVLTEWQAGRTVSAETVEAFGGVDRCFAAEPIPDGVWQRMQGKTYKENPYIGRNDLRHIRALHWDYDNQIHVGEMICNAQIADRVARILRQLFDAKYPIQRMLLPDVYDADDETQMRHNNSSSFCFRAIAGSTKLSKHARGLAIDINTLYNPYYKDRADGTRFIQPATAEAYCDRTKSFRYKIDHDDLCFRLFTEAGFEWGGDWTSCKDFQHFELIE